MKKRKYPKYHGADFDPIRKRLFDSLRKEFEWVVGLQEVKMSKEDIKTIAWNCAYVVVTKEY